MKYPRAIANTLNQYIKLVFLVVIPIKIAGTTNNTR
jgi:hypothetical protein